MKMHKLKSTISDNVLYIVEDDDDLLLVDPFDAEQVIEFVRPRHASRVRILTTHGHPDHAGGNAQVKEALGCEVLASRHAETFPVDCDRTIGDGDTLSVGATEFEIRHAPGHTDGHIVAYTRGHLISGDVFFVGGAGNCRFGGDVAEHHRTYTERLADLPDGTVFYPGHDYAEKNFEFCVEVEPQNSQAEARLEAYRRGDTRKPVLTTLGEERTYNPFHRTGEPTLQETLRERYPSEWDAAPSANDSERAFRVLRALRDSF